MGFFSWITQDTRRSIQNVHTGLEFPVMMTDNKGNRWIENAYDGYGNFGGKDYYELLAEMNGLTNREEGIDIYFGNKNTHPNALFPNLTEDMQWTWRNERPDDCPNQGFFDYDADDYEDDGDDWDDADNGL
jgi:hypothetical protein